MSPSNTTDKGLPTNVDAERFVLGSIMLDDSFYVQAAGTLEGDDFSLEKHRRIFKRMGELYERGEKIDRVTIANELMKFGELEACDGLSYLRSEEHTSELQSLRHLVCRLLLEKKKKNRRYTHTRTQKSSNNKPTSV